MNTLSLFRFVFCLCHTQEALKLDLFRVLRFSSAIINTWSWNSKGLGTIIPSLLSKGWVFWASEMNMAHAPCLKICFLFYVLVVLKGGPRILLVTPRLWRWASLSWPGGVLRKKAVIRGRSRWKCVDVCTFCGRQMRLLRHFPCEEYTSLFSQCALVRDYIMCLLLGWLDNKLPCFMQNGWLGWTLCWTFLLDNSENPT